MKTGQSTSASFRQALLVAMATVAAVLPYFGLLRMNSVLLWYDDEGYIMLMLQQLLDGKSLYTEVYSQYGTFFAQWGMLVFGLLGVPLDHDHNRMVAWVLWVAASALTGYLVYRCSRHTLPAMGVAALSFLYLEPLIKEPGHPQQIGLVLTLFAIFALSRKPSIATMALAGGATAALALSKINLGVFLFLSVVLAFSRELSRSNRRHSALLGALVLAGLLVVPFRGGISAPNAGLALTLLFSGTAALIAMHRSEPTSALRSRHILSYALGVAALTVVSIGYFLWSGTDYMDGAWAVVLQHSERFSTYDTIFPLYGALVAMLGLILCVALGRPRDMVMPHTIGIAKFVYGAGVVTIILCGLALEIGKELGSGESIKGHGATIWAVAHGFAWLLMLQSPGDGEWSEEDRRLRQLLTMVAVTSLLIPFPIHGTQISVGTLPCLLVAWVCLTDSLQLLDRSDRRLTGALRTTINLMLFLPLLSISAVSIAAAHGSYWNRLESPGLSGAKFLKLPPAQARSLGALVDAVQVNCSAFITIPGFSSLHFWTDMSPPTGLNMPSWMYFLQEAQLRNVMKELEKSPSPCIVYWVPSRFFEVARSSGYGARLGQYVLQVYGAAVQIDEYFILKRRIESPEQASPSRADEL